VTAAQRIAALDDMPAMELISRTDATLRQLASVMNEETVLLRAGHHRDAMPVTAEKTRLAQDYVMLSRAVQRQLDRLQAEVPDGLAALRLGHERLATQMAENLRVIATIKNVTEDLLGDVAGIVARAARPKTYGPGGQINQPANVAGGISVNRAL
jgi:hypothetical protein